MSDAETPWQGGPGRVLVRRARQPAIIISPIPGPSSLTALLNVVDIAPTPVTFLGFLPRRNGRQRKLLELHLGRNEAFVFFEAARRMPDTFQMLVEISPNREIAVGRELTKQYEEIYRGTAEQFLRERLHETEQSLKGECTVVVGPEDITGDQTSG